MKSRWIETAACRLRQASASKAMADTNYFVYVKATGAKVHADTTMEINPATISADGKTFTDMGFTCGICQNTTTNYWIYTNTNQLDNVIDIVPSQFPLTPDQYAAKQIQKEQANQIKLWAEGNIVATAQSLGITQIPVPFVDLYNAVHSIADTNTMSYMAGELNSWLAFYKDNGGDPWKVGGDFTSPQIKKVKVVKLMPKKK